MSEVDELRAEVARLRAKVKQLRDGGDDLCYVFVMTYGRSGSTLLMGLLNTIPGYLIRGENDDALRFLYDFHRTCVERIDYWPIDRVRRKTDAFYGIGDFPPAVSIAGTRRLAVETLLRPKPDTRVTGFKEIRWWRHEDLDAYVAWLREVFPGARFLVNTRNHAGGAEEQVVGQGRRPSPSTSPTSSAASWTPPPTSATRRTTSTSTTTSPTPVLAPMFAWLGEEYDEASVGDHGQEALGLTPHPDVFATPRSEYPVDRVSCLTDAKRLAEGVLRRFRVPQPDWWAFGQRARWSRRSRRSSSEGPPGTTTQRRGWSRARRRAARIRWTTRSRSSRSAPTTSKGSRPASRNRLSRATSRRCRSRLRCTAPLNSPTTPDGHVEQVRHADQPTAQVDERGVAQRSRPAGRPTPDQPQTYLLRRQRVLVGPRQRVQHVEAPGQVGGSAGVGTHPPDGGELGRGRHVHRHHPVLQRGRPPHLVEHRTLRDDAPDAVPDDDLVLAHVVAVQLDAGLRSQPIGPHGQVDGGRVCPSWARPSKYPPRCSRVPPTP